MGNNAGKGNVGAPDLLANFDDVELTRLDLRSKNIEHIPAEIAMLEKLTWLNLPNNLLTELPEHLCSLTALRTLRLLGNRLTHLPPSIGNLTNLTALDLSKNDFSQVDDSIGSLTALTDLNLHWNIVETLSPEVSKLTKLKTLNVSLNALSALPSLAPLALLEMLDLSHNRIHDINRSFKSLTKLATLNLAGNRLEHITGKFLRLPSLRTLDLQGNELKELPKEIANLNQLKYLRLRSNALTALNAAVSKLSSLVELSLAQNFIRKLPEGLGELEQLQVLQLYHNMLEELPADIGKLTNLRELGLAWNALKSLPSNVNALVQLTLLFVDHNTLSSLPDDVFQGLSKLQELHLQQNELTNIPSVSTCLDLRKLDVAGNKLAALPNTASLPLLGWLDAGDNHLPAVPPSVCQTTVLVILNLFGNRLTVLPPEIGLLVNLKKLYLAYNALSDASFPPASKLASLTELEELFINGNKLTTLPNALEALTSLTELDVSNNSLKELDAQVLPKLRNLSILHATCNKLTILPAVIGQLTTLTELDVAHNELETLPDDLVHLIGLTDLDVSDNALQRLPAGFEMNCSAMKQLKIAYNRFATLPVFTGPEGSYSSTWISAAGNAKIHVDLTDPVAVMNMSANKRKKGGKLGVDEDDSAASSEQRSGRSRKGTEQSENPPSISVPRTAKEWSHRRVVGWAEMRGRRPEMQDTLCVYLNYRGNPQRSLVGLFDGHSGELSAELVSQRVHNVVQRRLEAAERGVALIDDLEAEAKKQRELENRPEMRRGKARELQLSGGVGRSDGYQSRNASKADRKRKDKEHQKEKKSRPPMISSKASSHASIRVPSSEASELSESAMIRVLTGTFRELHAEITNRNIADGTAALVMLVEHDNKRLILGNAGDQRAVLARGKIAVQLTTDHKPEEPSEKVRVYDCGGFVNEQKRVDGILSLSRALGDNDLQPHVTYEPEIYTVELKDDDQFVILACDGLWDVVSNEKAVAIAAKFAQPNAAATALRDYAHMLGSTDNISVVVYRLDSGAAKTASSVDEEGRKSVARNSRSDERPKRRREKSHDVEKYGEKAKEDDKNKEGAIAWAKSSGPERRREKDRTSRHSKTPSSSSRSKALTNKNEEDDGGNALLRVDLSPKIRDKKQSSESERSKSKSKSSDRTSEGTLERVKSDKPLNGSQK